MFLTFALTIGSWFQTPAQIANMPEPFNPVLFKVKDYASRELCGKHFQPVAWITRRLKSGEQLTEQEGTRQGKALEKLADCYSTIELDIEPLLSRPAWLAPYLRAVKKELPSRKLHAAFYDWREEDFTQILVDIDGIDVMLYDTALKTASEYQTKVKDVVGKITRLLEKFPDKEIWMGLPTYQDRTKLHSARVENLENVRLALEGNSYPVLCSSRFKILYFAGYDMNESDKTESRKFQDWLKINCKQTSSRH